MKELSLERIKVYSGRHLTKVIAVLKRADVVGDIGDTLENLEFGLRNKDVGAASSAIKRLNTELHAAFDSVDNLSVYDYEYKEIMNFHTHFIDIYPQLEGLVSDDSLDEALQLFNMLVDYLESPTSTDDEYWSDLGERHKDKLFGPGLKLQK